MGFDDESSFFFRSKLSVMYTKRVFITMAFSNKEKDNAFQ